MTQYYDIVFVVTISVEFSMSRANEVLDYVVHYQGKAGDVKELKLLSMS